MKKRSQSLAAALLIVITLPAAIAVKSGGEWSSISIPAVDVIAMGGTEMSGGTSRMCEVDPIVLSDLHGGNGEVRNKLPFAPTITGLAFSIEKGNARSIRVDGNPIATFNSGGVAKVSFERGAGLAADAWRKYTIDGLTSDGSDSHLVFHVTPSVSATIDDVATELNVLPVYSLDARSGLVRNAIDELYCAGAVAIVSNHDAARRISKIHGSVSFAGTSSTRLTGVRITKIDGTLLSSAKVALSQNDFTITDFSTMEPARTYRVIVLLANALDGQPMRVELEAGFDR